MTSKNNEQIIPYRKREIFEAGLGMDTGYLLDFTDRTFNDFFYESIAIDPEEHYSLFNKRGTSKTKRLRSFIECGQPQHVAKLLRKLWKHRADLPKNSNVDENAFKTIFFEVVGYFEGNQEYIDTSEIDAYENNVTLEELVDSIKRDMEAKKPQAAMDHLHTYCMKRFSALVKQYIGEPCAKDTPLHSRVGQYVKLLEKEKKISPMSERIIKSSISIFEAFNSIRNDQSFAHDNSTLVSAEEAKFIFDSVTAILRFIKSIDNEIFEI